MHPHKYFPLCKAKWSDSKMWTHTEGDTAVRLILSNHHIMFIHTIKFRTELNQCQREKWAEELKVLKWKQFYTYEWTVSVFSSDSVSHVHISTTSSLICRTESTLQKWMCISLQLCLSSQETFLATGRQHFSFFTIRTPSSISDCRATQPQHFFYTLVLCTKSTLRERERRKGLNNCLSCLSCPAVELPNELSGAIKGFITSLTETKAVKDRNSGHLKLRLWEGVRGNLRCPSCPNINTDDFISQSRTGENTPPCSLTLYPHGSRWSAVHPINPPSIILTLLKQT